MAKARIGARLSSGLIVLALLVMLLGGRGAVGAVGSGVFFNTASAAPVL